MMSSPLKRLWRRNEMSRSSEFEIIRRFFASMNAQENGAFSLGNDAAAWSGACAKRIQRALIGGDTVATPGPLTLSLTTFGEVDVGQVLARRGTSVNNDIYM